MKPEQKACFDPDTITLQVAQQNRLNGLNDFTVTAFGRRRLNENRVDNSCMPSRPGRRSNSSSVIVGWWARLSSDLSAIILVHFAQGGPGVRTLPCLHDRRGQGGPLPRELTLRDLILFSFVGVCGIRGAAMAAQIGPGSRVLVVLLFLQQEVFESLGIFRRKLNVAQHHFLYDDAIDSKLLGDGLRGAGANFFTFGAEDVADGVRSAPFSPGASDDRRHQIGFDRLWQMALDVVEPLGVETIANGDGESEG